MVYTLHSTFYTYQVIVLRRNSFWNEHVECALRQNTSKLNRSQPIQMRGPHDGGGWRGDNARHDSQRRRKKRTVEDESGVAKNVLLELTAVTARFNTHGQGRRCRETKAKNKNLWDNTIRCSIFMSLCRHSRCTWNWWCRCVSLPMNLCSIRCSCGATSRQLTEATTHWSAIVQVWLFATAVGIMNFVAILRFCCFNSSVQCSIQFDCQLTTSVRQAVVRTLYPVEYHVGLRHLSAASLQILMGNTNSHFQFDGDGRPTVMMRTPRQRVDNKDDNYYLFIYIGIAWQPRRRTNDGY